MRSSPLFESAGLDASSIERLDLPFSQALPKWGLMRSGVLWQLPTPDLPTNGIAGGASLGMFPTPTASDNRNRAPSKNIHHTRNNTLRHMNANGQQSFMRLSQVVKAMYPTRLPAIGSKASQSWSTAEAFPTIDRNRGERLTNDESDMGRIVFDGLSRRLERYASAQQWAAPLGLQPYSFEPDRLTDDNFDWKDRIEAIGNSVCVPVVSAFGQGIAKALQILLAD
jgi:hypothetical protein